MKVILEKKAAKYLENLDVVMKKFDDMCFVEEEPEMNYTDEKSTVLKYVTA